MKRLRGITVSVVIAVIGSVAAFLFGCLMTLGAVTSLSTPLPTNPGQAPLPFSPSVLMFLMSVFYFGFGAWGLISSVGLYRLRNWARICFAIFGGLLAFISLGATLGLLVGMAVLPGTMLNQNNVPAGLLTIVFLVFTAIALLCASLGVTWIIYFNRQAVKIQFLGELIAAKPRTFPMSISILSWVLVVGGVFCLLELMFNTPLLVLGFTAHGWASRVAYLGFAIVSCTSGIGMLRKQIPAHSLAVGYFVFGLLNSLSMLLPGTVERFQQLLPVPTNVPFVITPRWLLIVSLCSGLAGGGLSLWFLLTRRERFVEACGQ